MNLSHKHKKLAGFTLIELMVTIGIVMLVTSIALVRYGSFNNSLLLKSQAFEIALDVRQAQQYAISASTFTGNHQDPFGMYFDISNPNTYSLYQDANNNVYYNTGEQVGAINIIDPRFRISDICTKVGGTVTCGKTKASIAFKRPNFDAKMYDQTAGATTATQVDIVIEAVNGNGTQRTISVYQSGQISVH